MTAAKQQQQLLQSIHRSDYYSTTRRDQLRQWRLFFPSLYLMTAACNEKTQKGIDFDGSKRRWSNYLYVTWRPLLLDHFFPFLLLWPWKKEDPEKMDRYGIRSSSSLWRHGVHTVDRRTDDSTQRKPNRTGTPYVLDVEIFFHFVTKVTPTRLEGMEWKERPWSHDDGLLLLVL